MSYYDYYTGRYYPDAVPMRPIQVPVATTPVDPYNGQSQIVGQTANQNPPMQLANQSGVVYIKDEREARMYPMAPNTILELREFSGKALYRKTTGPNGELLSFKIFDVVERPQSSEQSGEGNKSPDSYASKDELNAVLGSIKDIANVVSSLKNNMDKMNDDLYGIAGKKKNYDKEIIEND